MLKNLIRLTNGNLFLRQVSQPLKERGLFLRAFATEKDGSDGVHQTAASEKVGKVNEYRNPFAKDTSLQKNGSLNESLPLSDEERTKRLKVLQLEVDIARQEGRRAPSLEFITDQHWEHILTLPTRSARSKYYSYLWQIEMKKEARERKKELRLEEGIQRRDEIRKEREENDHIIYGLGHTSLFLRIYDSTINHWQNNRLIQAMQFSPKIVIDCSYDQYMTKREATNAAKQLMLCFAENRAHDNPFDLHYCNVNTKSICIESLKRYIPTMLNVDFPMNVHEKCFTEIFPKENLVYLTPHCRTDLEAYNPDDVYIIGAMVDTVNNEPLSLAKAKKLGLRMARLPLDKFLQWGAGSGKTLTINQVINIMLDLKSSGDWNKSLSHVPRRKIIDVNTKDFRGRNLVEKRAQKLNMVRVDRLFGTDDEASSNKVRSRKDNLQFNLDTWATKKKSRNSN